MKVLVTGGTGVVGRSVVRALHDHGHLVRILTRHGGRDEKWWPSGVEGWAGDVANEESVRGSGNGCDVLVHAAAISSEDPPEHTFQAVNIEGTRYMTLEAERAGIKKVIYLSSLGADRGTTPYHKSKCVAEDVVEAFSRDWLVLRPGAVYGPGDEHVSVILWAVRTLPIVPTIGDGNQKFQPIWHEDLAKAVVLCAERDDVRRRVLELAGPDLTSQNDLMARLRVVTGRPAPQAPLPQALANWGMRALDALGIAAPIGESQIGMLADGNVIAPGVPNALTDVFGIAPTRLDDGLRRLALDQPEQLPNEGVGALTRRSFWIDIRGGRYDADGLFEYVLTHFAALMPPLIEVRPDLAAPARLAEGVTITFDLPVRGQVQVRVREAADRRLSLLTISGHPIAGGVRFLVDPHDDAIRFEIQVYERPATMADQILMRAGGEWLQRESWRALLRNVASAAGGAASDVQQREEVVEGHDAEVVEEWAATLSAQPPRHPPALDH